MPGLMGEERQALAPAPAGGAPSDIPQEAAPDTGGAAAEVTGALKTLLTFAASMKEKGDPKGTQMLSALQGVVQSLQGGAQGEAPKPVAPEEQAPVSEPSMGSNAMPENAAPGAEQIL